MIQTVIIAGLLAVSMARPDPSPQSVFGDFQDFTSRFQAEAERNAREQAEGMRGIFDGMSQGITREVADVKQPIEEMVFQGIDTVCSTVKGMIGVKYNQYGEQDIPDLNQLTLDFITPAYKIVYNIEHAARAIPQSKDFKPNETLYIFAHGFIDDPTSSTFGHVRKALFSTGKSNVIALDGSKFINWLYLRSTTYVRFMGERLGQVLASMVDKYGVDPANVHLIGHSLGAHIAGFAGKTFNKLSGKHVGRISGLDPAGPCFGRIDADLRLSKSDADYVDAMHTDGQVLGLLEPVGHVDYYPNQGIEQPGCLMTTCSHSRAWLLFTESVINEKAFPAVKCDSWRDFADGACDNEISYMGFPSEPGTNGKYYLQTAADEPFGIGMRGIRYRSHNGMIKNMTEVFLG
ncbi:lipase domain-containing protein [Phthorimaea operculella]|nr:lipase domain-containing protein [Phthorimaea operculella]